MNRRRKRKGRLKEESRQRDKLKNRLEKRMKEEDKLFYSKSSSYNSKKR